MKRTIALTITILYLTTMSLAQSGAQLNRLPAHVKFVTSDIEFVERAGLSHSPQALAWGE